MIPQDKENVDSESAPQGTPRAAPDILVHLHIPKTGGTSLNSIVQHGFRIDEVLGITVFGDPGTEQRDGLGLIRSEYFRQQLALHTTNDLKRIRYITGHLPFGLHCEFGRPAKYFSVIRDPIERVISDFYFGIQSNEPYHVNGKPMKFDEFVESEDVRSCDYQVRIFSGYADLDTKRTPVERHHLEQAKRNIEDHFLAVAPLERMTELALLIRYTYRWPMRRLLTEYKLKTRSRPRANEISPRLIKAIEARNAFDLELYDWVQSRFATQCRLFEPQLSRDLRVYNIVTGILNDASQILPWQVRKRLAQVLFYA